jgi:hypothetical protein
MEVYVILKRAVEGPNEIFVEIETADGKSVSVPDELRPNGIRAIGPLILPDR